MGTLIAGPICGRLLGDYGADVIKVEDPGRGDQGRTWGQNKLDGESLWWPTQGRNKRSVTIDLRTEDGQATARDLLGNADVVVENFRPGTLEKWGLGPDDLEDTNPGLIYVRISGFGQTGPASSRAGFGAVGEAIGGIRNTTGDPDRAPARTGISLGDQLASMFGVIGALLALRAREGTGRGQVVDVALYEAVFALTESMVTDYAALGVLPQRTGGRLPGVAPSNAYPTSEDDGWVVIAGNADTVFRRLADAMGRPELAEDPRFSHHHARADHVEELDAEIAAWTRTLTAREIVAVLDDAGVPASKIYTPADMVADEQFWARDSLLRVAHERLGELVVPGVFPRLSHTPGSVRWLGPELGEHNDEILRPLQEQR